VGPPSKSKACRFRQAFFLSGAHLWRTSPPSRADQEVLSFRQSLRRPSAMRAGLCSRSGERDGLADRISLPILPTLNNLLPFAGGIDLPGQDLAVPIPGIVSYLLGVPLGSPEVLRRRNHPPTGLISAGCQRRLALPVEIRYRPGTSPSSHRRGSPDWAPAGRPAPPPPPGPDRGWPWGCRRGRSCGCCRCRPCTGGCPGGR
jgi:hypothetical protein